MNYLSVDGISKSYGIKTLFSDVTFGIEKGDKTALIASNGSGKSTLLKILVGKESADTGTVTFANDIRVGYLEQLPKYDPELNIQDIIDQAAREHSVATMEDLETCSYEQRLIQMLTRFELNDLEQKIGNLSGGQVKRLALAIVLLDNPDLLILDEPLHGLDNYNRRLVKDIIETFCQRPGKTLIIVTHYQEELPAVIDHAITLQRH